jgi:hypothetical protein
VIELHGARRKPTTAVSARDVAQLIEQVGVVAPSRALFGQAWASGPRWITTGKPITMLAPSSEAVAVRANNVALRDFAKQDIPALQRRLRQCEALQRRVAMVERHLYGMKAPAAVGTWAVP